jgi:hypothetical protein
MSWGESRKVFVNKERRRLEYEHSGSASDC